MITLFKSKRFWIDVIKTSRLTPQFVKGQGKLTLWFSFLGLGVMVIDYYKPSGPQDTFYGPNYNGYKVRGFSK